MNRKKALSPTRPLFDGPDRWPFFIGLVRIGMLGVIAVGTFLVADRREPSLTWLPYFYVLGFGASTYYLFSLRGHRDPRWLLTWAQLLTDFGVVAATVSFTGAASSFFTFLFVVVILESGLLLGPRQGFIFATLATAFMAVEFLAPRQGASGLDAAGQSYSFLVQSLAYYLTASISGYWNLRLHRMQQFQREILDNMNSGFLITDAGGGITAQNAAADRLLGIVPGGAVGRPVQEILRVASGEECPVLTALRAERDFTSYEFHARVANDEVKLLGLTTSPIYDAQRVIRGIIASFTDLTEMARMREELQRQDRLAVVGELAAGLAHEIRNPVAAIRGAVDEIGSNIGTPAIAEKLANIAIRESDHLNQIVTDFLDFARCPSPKREAFDVAALAREVADWFRNKHRESAGLVIETSLPEGRVRISGDRAQIKQVFVNVVKNAIEAMQEEGTLRIEVIVGANFVETRFEDSGPGIPPDEVARIFDPFYTTKESGVGMGLAVCMRIVTAHDGVIRPTPREGGGTSMSVRLPLNRQEDR